MRRWSNLQIAIWGGPFQGNEVRGGMHLLSSIDGAANQRANASTNKGDNRL